MDPSAYRECRLCPRDCRVDRTAGERGACGETARCRVASMGPHHGEEPPLSGTRGSGTVFFSGCSCGCLFCQNWQISREHDGEEISVDGLERRLRELVSRGVHNLNFVTPDHFWPHVREVCLRLRRGGVAIPFVWNSSGYVRPEMVPAYAEVMDIFLPDFKFSDPRLAERCMGDARYPEYALAALERMLAAVGPLRPWDETFRRPAERGVLVRHLVLPGYPENSLRALDLLHERFGGGLPLSVMSQFRPPPACREAGFLDAPVPAREYARICRRVEELGFEHVFVQPGHGDGAFVPDFRREGEPFRGNRQHAGRGGGPTRRPER